MSDDAVKLAREFLGGPATWPVATAITLARAVIAQDEELAKLRAALGEALEMTWDNDALEPEDHDRIAELRKLVTR